MKTIKELEAIKEPDTYWYRKERVDTLKDVLGLIDEWAKDKLPQKEVEEELPVPKELKGFVKPMKRKSRELTIFHKDHIEELKKRING